MKKVLFKLISDPERHARVLEDSAKRLNIEIEKRPGISILMARIYFTKLKGSS